MSKKKKQESKRNPRTIITVVVLIAICSGLSFYLGIAAPHNSSIPIDLGGSMIVSLNYQSSITFGPFHTGVRVAFEVIDTTHSWTLSIFDTDANPLGGLSGSTSGLYETVWLYSPEGIVFWIQSSTSLPTTMNLDGILTITSSRFPFI